MSIYKRIPANPKQYHPVQAVKHLGDNWRYGHGVDISVHTSLAMAEYLTHDQREAYMMKDMERGLRARVEGI